MRCVPRIIKYVQEKPRDQNLKVANIRKTNEGSYKQRTCITLEVKNSIEQHLNKHNQHLKFLFRNHNECSLIVIVDSCENTEYPM